MANDKTKAELEAEVAALKAKLNEAAPAAAGNVPAGNGVGDELVTVELFKDNGKYKDPLLVCVNGESVLIQRGTPVKIKRKFLWAIEQSQLQDRSTARLIAEESESFREMQRKHLDD